MYKSNESNESNRIESIGLNRSNLESNHRSQSINRRIITMTAFSCNFLIDTVDGDGCTRYAYTYYV